MAQDVFVVLGRDRRADALFSFVDLAKERTAPSSQDYVTFVLSLRIAPRLAL